jgi:hypothetical protein
MHPTHALLNRVPWGPGKGRVCALSNPKVLTPLPYCEPLASSLCSPVTHPKAASPSTSQLWRVQHPANRNCPNEDVRSVVEEIEMLKIALPLPLLFLLLCLSAFAQTTLTVGSKFHCDAASAQPIFSFSEFQCRGVPLYQNGTKVDWMYWLNSSRPEEWWLGGNMFPSSPYQGSIAQVTQFSLPTLNGNLPCGASTPLNGTVTFTVQFTDNTGLKHTGTFSGNWGESKVCGRYGWYLPVLQAGDQLMLE